MPCPKWLREVRDLNNPVKSWIDLSKQNENTVSDDALRDKYLKDFKVEEKINYNKSEFRDSVKAKRKEKQYNNQQDADNIWGDNLPDLDEEDE